MGAVTALGLARQGVKVRLFEKRDELGSEERATTFHPPTLELLEHLGLAEPLISRGLVCDEYQYRDADEGRIAVLHYDVLDGLTPYPFRLQVEQSVLTRLARKALAAHANVDLLLGTQVTDIGTHDDGFSLSTDRGTFTSSYLVGADGSHSLVRDQLGIPFEGRTYPERYLVVSTSLPLHEIFPDTSPVNYVAGASVWHVLLRNPAGWRMLFPIRPDTQISTDERETQALHHMQRLWPEATSADIQHVTVYDVHRKVAGAFRRGRAFLVGDAAHVNNPLGGMGMNSGLHDGLLLIAPLVKAVRGEPSDADLDEWARRRRDVALNFVGKETDDNWKRVQESSPERRAEVQREWRRLEADAEARRAHLRRASMLDSLEGVAR